MIFSPSIDLRALSGLRYGLPLLMALALVSLPVDAQPRSSDEASESDARADLDDEPYFPWVGEELYYSVRVNDSEAMRGGVRVGQIERHNESRYVPINATAQSRGFLDAAYPIDDRANTYLNPDSSFPFRSEKEFNENNRFRSYDVDYRHRAFIAQVERHREERESRFQSPIPEQTHDMLTWVYDLRQHDELSLGDEFQYFIYDGWLLSRLHLEVVDREEILSPIGWFNTWKISFRREILDPEQPDDNDESGSEHRAPELTTKEEARHTGHIWVSRDENHIPVQLTIDTTFGPGTAVLIHYEPGSSR